MIAQVYIMKIGLIEKKNVVFFLRKKLGKKDNLKKKKLEREGSFIVFI